MDTENPIRFWSKVDIGEPEECWEWQAALGGQGYGKFNIHYQNRQAHRVAWYLAFGPIPKGLCVLHKCDNPGCVNPYHLFLGTHTDNMRDCVRKGRQGRQTLSVEDVREIRKLLEGGDLQRDMADLFGVSTTTINLIQRGKIWAWLE